MTNGSARGFCPRCLLEEVAGAEDLAAKMKAWVDAIPPEDRAPDAAVQARLEACRRCPWLNGGLCGQCGCYVELRAAKARRRCPDVPPRWPQPEAP